MRWSTAFIPTLRDDPADAEAISHKLLIRAGFARQLMAGVYSLLPLGLRVSDKIEGIIRAEMNQIGGQQFACPVCIRKKSGNARVDGKKWAVRCFSSKIGVVPMSDWE